MQKWMIVLMALSGCGASGQPSHEAPDSNDAKSWAAFDIAVPDRDPRELVASFESRAREVGCATNRLGERSVGMAGRGNARISAGVRAKCEEGTISLWALDESQVRIACQKPTTRERCEALLRRISAPE